LKKGIVLDINILRSISTLLLFIAFVGMCIWVFSAKRKKSYEDAAQLPFADEDDVPGKKSKHL